MQIKFTRKLRKELDDLIFKHEYKNILIEKTNSLDNECMIKAFFRAGIIDFDEVIQAVWKIARDQEPDSVEGDDRDYPVLVYIWESIEFSRILKSLDIEEDELSFSDMCPNGKKVYFKIRHDGSQKELVIISLHIARW